MKLSKQFTTVTRLTKLIAMALFIALPFLGFHYGVEYRDSIASPILVDSQISGTK